jgi:DNA-binding transcriptional LysR family regulator
LAKAREPLTEAQLRAHRAVAVGDSARRLPTRSTGLLSGQDTLTVPTVRAKLRMQVEGLGVGYLPAACAQEAVKAGLLVRKQVEADRAPEWLSVAWRVGAEGNALSWWLERLTDPASIRGLLRVVARSHGTDAPARKR